MHEVEVKVDEAEMKFQLCGLEGCILEKYIFLEKNKTSYNLATMFSAKENSYLDSK